MKYYEGAITWHEAKTMPFDLLLKFYDEMQWQSKEQEKAMKRAQRNR